MQDTKRKRALIVPREHGGWGILLIPLATGAFAGAPGASRVPGLIAFLAAALTLYWLRTPLESWMGSAPMRAQGADELRLVRRAAFALALAAVIALALVFRGGRNESLWWFGTAAAASFAMQTALRKRGNSYRVAAQIVGSAGLTATGPAAYYLATGVVNATAISLWAANFVFAANQIQFVQMRIHAAKPLTPKEKIAAGRAFLQAHCAVAGGAGLAMAAGWIPWYLAAAFLPTLIRGFAWFARKPEPLRIHALGWSELRNAMAFGALIILGNQLG